MARVRADQLLVRLGHFESRARAQAAIVAGLVSIDGAVVRRASDLVAEDAAISAAAPHPYVSRGGLKLSAALDAFAIDPAGLPCLDVGASTGGFSEVLLQRGAAHVIAVDVGRAQLHPRLAAEARLTSLEGTDIRTLSVERLPARPTLAVIDVSFISLKLVLPAVAALLAPACDLVALVKPQFEAGRAALKKGIVRDEVVRRTVVADVLAVLAGLGFAARAPIPSPIEGGDGNVEFLVGARRVG